jgi:hypothetical protein
LVDHHAAARSSPGHLSVAAFIKVPPSAVLNNSLGPSLDRWIGGESTEVRGVEAIVRVGEATVTLDTQIGVNGPCSRALGNMMVGVEITPKRKGSSDTSVAKLGSPAVVAKRLRLRDKRPSNKCSDG